MASWEGALNRGRGRGPICNLRQMADRLHWVPTDTGWRQGLDSSLATQTLRQLKLDSQSQKDSVKSALNAALGGAWHEVRANSVFEVGEVCVRCGESVENLKQIEHIVHHCPAWAAERRE
eukprot:3264130-Amphidinium_carterae.2